MQGAAYWRYADARELRWVVSSRTRFPTIFERFSTRFGTAIPNPDLEPERAINYEMGWTAQLTDRLDLSTALFYADVEDMIQTVVVSAGPPQLTQALNVGDGEFYGVELGIQSQLTELWSVAATYTHLEREIVDPLQPGDRGDRGARRRRVRRVQFRAVSQALDYAERRARQRPLERGHGGGYIRTGDYTLLNLQVEYRGDDFWSIAAGGTNLLDEDFQLAHGYPEPGRSAYLRLRLEF